MLNREFFFWLCGYFDICGNDQLTQRQWEMIQRHYELMLSVSLYCPSIVAMNLENDPDLSKICHTQIQDVRPTEAEIMYWLQGFFEISGFEGELTKSQQERIVDMFRLNNSGISPRGMQIYLKVTENSTQLRNLLNQMFQHVIDQSYGLSEEEMIKTGLLHG